MYEYSVLCERLIMRYLLSVLFAALAIALCAGCREKEKGLDAVEIVLKDVFFSKCIGAKQELSTESVGYKGDASGWLYVEHTNTSVDCGADSVLVVLSVNMKELVIEENESSHDANCYCPSNLTYMIGPLVHGERYHIIMKNAVNDVHKFSFVYSHAMDTVVVF